MDETSLTPEMQQALAATDQLIAANHGRVLALQEAMAARVDAAREPSQDVCKRIKARLKSVMKGIASVSRDAATNLAGILMGGADALIANSNQNVSFLATRLATAGPPPPLPGQTSDPRPPAPVAPVPLPPARPSEPLPGMSPSPPPPGQRPFGGIGIPCPPGVPDDQCVNVPGFAPPPVTSPSPTAGGAPVRSAAGQWVIYADCPVVVDICNGRYDGTSGVRVADQDRGDTIPCPAALACRSPVWHRYPGLSWPANPGIAGLTQFDNLLHPGSPACQWAEQCTAAPPTPPAPPPPQPGQGYCLYYLCDPLYGPRIAVDLCGHPPSAGWQQVPGSLVYGTPADANNAVARYQATVAQLCQTAPPLPQPIPQPSPPAPPVAVKPASCITATCTLGDTPGTPSKEEEECDNWTKVVNSVVGTGKLILGVIGDSATAVGVIPAYARYVIGCVTQDPPGLNSVWTALCECYKREKACSLLGWWESLLGTFFAPNATDLYAALAVKAVLESYATAKVDAKLSDSEESNWEGSIGLEIFHLGGGKGAAGKTDAAYDFSEELKPYIVPALEIVDKVVRYLAPVELPAVPEVIESYLRRTITDDQAKCLLRLNGADWDRWYPIIFARRENLTPEEYIQWARRNDIPDATILDGLRYLGWLSPGEAAAKYQLYDELPTINDHLLWLQRNVFDNSYVTDFNLLDGFATQDQIRQLPGYGTYVVGPDAPPRNFWDAFGHDLRALGMKEEYAANHYAAHWLMPSPGERQEMVFRLRPGAVPANLVFTERDYVRTLAETDVAPYFRRRLAEIAYRVYPLRQLNAAVQQGRLDRDAVIGAMQDMGFKLDKATIVGDTIITQGRRTAASAAHGFTAAVVAKLAPYNLISRQDASKYLNPQGFTEAQIDELFQVAELELVERRTASYGQSSLKAYAALVLKAYGDGAATEADAFNALRSAGYPEDAATLELRQEDLKQRWSALRAAVKAIRYAFMHGEVDAAGAATALVAAGVADPRIPQYVTQWQLSMTVPRLAATKAEILRFAKEGIISIAVAEVRLANIGVPPSDIQLYVLELQQTIEQARLKAQAKAAKELRQAQAAAQRVIDQTRNKFCKWYSDAKMIRWYAHRIIEESTFRDRLKVCGRTPEVIDNLFAEAQAARAKADEAAAKAKAGPKAKPPPHLAAGKLKHLYAIHSIDETVFRTKLKQLGYEDDDVQNLWEEAQVARDKVDAETAAKGPTGREYTGPGHDA